MVTFHRPIICSILLRMAFKLPESCHAADTFYSPSFTMPYPHSDTFFSSRPPLSHSLPFLVASLMGVLSQAREIHISCHDLYVFGYSCSRFSLGRPSKLSVIPRPSTIILSL